MDIPRLNQCFICKAWRLEESLAPVEVADQVGYVQKLICKECMEKINPGSPIRYPKEDGKHERPEGIS